MKILAIYSNNYLEIGIPTGLATLSAILKNEGHDIVLFDYTFLKTEALTEENSTQKSIFKPTSVTLNDLVKDDEVVNIEDEFEKLIQKESPELIIVSTMTSSFQSAIDLLTKKKNTFSCKV